MNKHEILTETHDECGGQLEERIYSSHDNEIDWRLHCLKCHKELGFAVLCPVCLAIMQETKNKYENNWDDEFTEHICPICHNTTYICTFENEN